MTIFEKGEQKKSVHLHDTYIRWLLCIQSIDARNRIYFLSLRYIRDVNFTRAYSKLIPKHTAKVKVFGPRTLIKNKNKKPFFLRMLVSF